MMAREMKSKEQEIPRGSLLVQLNHRMTEEFDKILTESRTVSTTLAKLEFAEKNMDEIEALIEQTLDLGN